MGLGCRAKASGLFPEGDVEASKVLKQRPASMHPSIHFLVLFSIYEALSPCLLWNKAANKACLRGMIRVAFL